MADNALGAFTELMEKPGSTRAKDETVAILSTTQGAAKTTGDTLIAGALQAVMTAQEKANNLPVDKQRLGRPIDSAQSNYEQRHHRLHHSQPPASVILNRLTLRPS